MLIEFATDSGPKCAKCEQTLWGYHVQHWSRSEDQWNTDVWARCACCHREVHFSSRFKLENVADVRNRQVDLVDAGAADCA